MHTRLRSLLPLLAASVAVALATTRCAAPAPAGVSRTYYIAADPVDWDYAPADSNLAYGRPLGNAFHMAGVRTSRQDKVLRKAVYRAYTDSTFTKLKPRPAKWRHLGMLGPVVRGAVGDTIVIVFRNNTDFPASVHPHGVFYDKSSEGALYNDGTSGADKLDDSVPPGGTHRYVWPIPARAGPGPSDPSSILWLYHSHTNEPMDVNTGLIGPIIVTRRGMARPDGSPKDVDREFVTMFASVNERLSHYFKQNLRRYTGDTATRGPKGPILFHSGGAGDLYDAINGLSYGSLPVSSLTMKVGEHVRWYVFSFTNLVDQHTPHWHGNTVLVRGHRTDDLDLDGPFLMVTADMVPDNPGTWLYHCHVAEHALAMSTRYRVLPADGVVPADTAQARTVDPATGIVTDFARGD